MKLVLLALAIIGYCFDINSAGCCSCCNSCKSNNGNGGGGGNLESKKSVPTGRGHKHPKGKEVVRKGDIQKIEVSNDGVSIIFSYKSIQLGEENLLDGDGCEGLVNIWFKNNNSIGKNKEIRIYKIPVTEISLPEGIHVEIDNAIKSSPYLIAIGLDKDGNHYFMVCVGDNLSELFNDSNRLKRLFIFESDGIVNMYNMFRGCKLLESLNLSNFNTSSVTYMSYMFADCESLKSLNLSNFNTSSVTDMSYMFDGCESLELLNLSNFNTSNVTDMSYMFYNCKSLKELRLSDFNTNKVIKMENMFAGCNSLKSLDLSNFNTSNVTDMSYMFYKCSSLENLILGDDFITTNVKYKVSMFKECGPIKELNLSKFNFDVAEDDCLMYFISNSNILKIIFGKKLTKDCLIKQLASAWFESPDGGITWIRRKPEKH